MTFYDSNGNPVVYCDDGEHVYTFVGEPVAYFDGDSLYSFDGRHLGWFKNGWLRDNSGACVFFTERASGGPIRPMKAMKPMKALRGMKPMKSLKAMRPMRPIDMNDWSKIQALRFFT